MVDSQPLASIIIPVYNGAEYVKDAIESALSQTYTNVEVLVVNDGSTDGGATRDVALTFGSRIKYIEKDNGGVASALNLGIQHSSGEWLYWLSHDDFYAPERVISDMSFAKDNPQARVLFSGFHKVNEKKERLSSVLYSDSQIRTLKQLIDNNSLHFCTITVHKHVYEKVGYFNELNRSNQDVEMIMKITCSFHLHLVAGINTYVRDLSHLNIKKFNRQQFVSDSKYIADYLHDNTRVENFFEDVEAGVTPLFLAHEFIGYFYAYTGAHHYAREQFRLAYKYSPDMLNSVKLFFRIRKHMLKSPEIRYWFFYPKYLLAVARKKLK